VQPNVEIKRT